MALSGTALRIAIGVTAGLCFVSYGYGQGDIGGLMVMPTFQQYFPQIAGLTVQTGRIVGITVGIWNLGCFVGAMILVLVGNTMGRKGAIITGLLIMLAGKIIQTSTFGFAQYLAGRFIAGFGNGWIVSTVPAWQAECLKSHRRGTLLMVSFGSCITAGLAIAYWVVYALSWAQPSPASWRVPVGLAVVPILLALSLIVWMPESPRYLILSGRQEEAKKVLSALNEISPEDENVRREFLMIKKTLLTMTSASFVEAFKQGRHRYLQRTVLAVVLQVMQQFTGINLFMQYLGSMFLNQLRYKPELALLLAACCATEFFIASIIAVIGIDRFWTRRTLTMFGATGMCISTIVLCVMAWLNTQRSYYVMTAFLFAFNSFFAIGWQGMAWLWAVELTPLPIRGPANALSTAANWLANFIVVLCTPILFLTTEYRTYIVFAATNLCIVPIIYFLYPETGARSLEEVDLIFSAASERGNAWFSAVHTARQKDLPWPASDHAGDHPSETYESEKDATNSSSEKSKAALLRHNDADRWADYRRTHAHSDPSSSSEPDTTPSQLNSFDHNTTAVLTTAPNQSNRSSVYGINRTEVLPPSPGSSAASPPPDILGAARARGSEFPGPHNRAGTMSPLPGIFPDRRRRRG
ncbi:hypothetical protein LTR62_000690 [Meristemomyces frigidus]|uniref:Major facilitator superfamily (MFS) profile domain-containing protein n=1 Tax=Meristemomyces frigidus TaxID=1508187 RepID=A0AAN7YC85_9PEZI|nr:hypothetical protein LTR62_000690 [Meristemomyces frigidus]